MPAFTRSASRRTDNITLSTVWTLDRPGRSRDC